MANNFNGASIPPSLDASEHLPQPVLSNSIVSSELYSLDLETGVPRISQYGTQAMVFHP